MPLTMANPGQTVVIRKITGRDEVRQHLAKLARESASTLQSLWTRAQDEVARLKALEELASGRFGFALLGYVPVKAKPKVEEALRDFVRERVLRYSEHEAPTLPKLP